MCDLLTKCLSLNLKLKKFGLVQLFLFTSGHRLVVVEVFTFDGTVGVIFVDDQKVNIIQLKVLQ